MSFPEVSELIPHSGPMLLVRHVLEHSEERTVCEVDPADSSLFATEDGGIPAWLALEYMAQCAAVHGGLSATESGTPMRAGMLVGTRRLRLAVETLRPGKALQVSVACVHAGSQLLSFAGEVRAAEGEVLAEARFNVYMADGPRETMK